jgi:hypothetical protein
MSGEVVELDVVTRLDIPPERVLNRALKADLDGVVVIGWKKGDDGDFYFVSSIADGPEVNWLLDMAKARLLKVGGATPE